MTSLTVELELPRATCIRATDDTLTAELADGRSISVPLAWYPRLVHATPEERNHWQLIGDGQHIHWEELDEDISVENLMAGQRSGESKRSFERWLTAKKEGRGLTLYELRQVKRNDEAAG